MVTSQAIQRGVEVDVHHTGRLNSNPVERHIDMGRDVRLTLRFVPVGTRA
jgi:hypothetical protein